MLSKSSMLATASMSVMLSVALATPAVAQGPQGGNEEAVAQDIVVTGSRIVRRDYESASPILTLSQDTLANQADTGLDTKLARLPQFTPGGTRFSGSGQATLNLRGLGTNRNLVLLDGRRLQPSTAQVVVDLNSVPQSLIENVEVISGGASAVYGSDAVSGVVNFKLKRNFTGVELDGQYNIGEKGDGAEYETNLTIGSDLADGRGNIVVALTYNKRDALLSRERDFYRAGWPTGERSFATTFLPSGIFNVDATNLPSLAARNALFNGYGTPVTGSVSSTAYGFNQDGTLFAQNGARNYRGPLDDGHVITPAGNVAYNQQDNLLVVPMERYTGFFRATYELTDDIEIFAQGMYTQYDSRSQSSGAATNGPGAINLPSDYAFITADLRTLLNSRPNPNAPFIVNKFWSQLGPQVTLNRNTVAQYTVGGKGKIGTNWNWNAYGSFGRTDLLSQVDALSNLRVQTMVNSRSTMQNGVLVNVPQFYAPATGNSLTPNPAYALATNDGGRTIASIDGGPNPCPNGLNVFGTSPLEVRCIDYLRRSSKTATRVEQTVLEGTVSGAVATLPAGELAVVLGAGYRKNSYAFAPDGASEGITGDAVGIFPSNPTAGSTSVREIFGEALIPLLSDLPGVEKLDLNVAYRYSDYDNSGGVSTYKADVNWTVFPALRLRGGYERAIRAPNVAELFQGQVINGAGGTLTNGDPCDFNSPITTGANAGNRSKVDAICVAQGLPAALLPTFKNTQLTATTVTSGNPTLRPEVADTFTAGAVIQPRFSSAWLRGMSLSVDFYKIKVKKAIGAFPAAVVYSKCYNLDGSNPTLDANNPYCTGIVRSATTGLPFIVQSPFVNLGSLDTSGIDIQFDWNVDLADAGLGENAGSFSLNFVGSYLDSFNIQARPGTPNQDFSGTIGNTTTGVGTFPRWKSTATVAYANGPARVGVRWFHVASMDDQSAVSSPNAARPGVGGYDRFDLFGRFTINDTIQLRAGVDNVFNKDPMVVGGVLGSTEPGTYDPLGRRFFLGARIGF
jgi:iron complex outermembrane receptor protein